ncbi:hypothetical protein [Amycolatopsis camponoti]|uniref:hypothetical protein n=1 Tax=Amycolatopsis camponoti TaxID=2606593 RepID=UPI0012D790BA|nr:hypothetical protein [Amycolatopsis camponoti]
MAASAVPPTRLPQATRVAIREVLLAELLSARTRARAAGCPPEILFDALDARLRSAATEDRGVSCAGSRSALAEEDRGLPGARLCSAAEDLQDSRHDPLEPGLVGESGG